MRPGPIQGDMVHPYLRRRQGKEKAEYPKPELRGNPRQDARRAAVPGAGDEDRHRRRRLHAGRGRRVAARHGDLQAHRHDRQLPPEDDRRHGGQWLRRGIRRALLQADRGVRRIRLSRKPCGLLRAAGLCLLLVQDLLSGRLLRRDPQCAADGLLCPGAARARRARAWRGSARGRHQPLRLGLHAGADALRCRRASTTAMARCAASSGRGMRCGSGCGRSRACREARSSSWWRGAATATIRCATSGCAPVSMSTRSRSWRRPMPSARSVSTGATRYGPCARWTGGARPKSCRCSTGRTSACATTSRRRCCP